jgi:formylglycine-generating enzyme required for sulfatase activity
MSNRFLRGRLQAGLALLMLACSCGREGSGTMEPGPQEPGKPTLTWLPIPGGTFDMGCSPGDEACLDDESPRHRVTVSSFDMLDTEVTESQYELVMRDNPSCRFGRTSGPDMPVECVSFDKAAQFCKAVGGRLPSEAEWEYAARGGTTTKFPCGNDDSCLVDIAWYGVNSGKRKHDVKGKLPNSFGLYDMLGNVYEWTSDLYDERYYATSPEKDPRGPDRGLFRVRRGGDFYHYDGKDLSVSSRTYQGPWDGPGNLGFRCVRAVRDPR